MENYEGISVMSASDECGVQNDVSASSSVAVPSSLLGHLTSAADLDAKQESVAGQVFVVADKSHIDVLHVQVWQGLLFLLLFV